MFAQSKLKNIYYQKNEKEQRKKLWMFQLVDYIIIGDLTWEVFN